MARELITQAEYARRRGVAKSAVAKAVKEERITLFDGMIDPEIADIQWARNTRARADSAKAPKGGSDTTPEAQSHSSRSDYDLHRTRREKADASRSEIALAKEAGELMERKRGVQAAFTAFRALRDSGMLVGRKVSTRLVPLTEPREIQLVIDAELREVFTVFAKRTLATLAAALQGTGVEMPPDLLATEEPADEQASDLEAWEGVP
ncbi:MAG: hypothetical protein HEQ39_09610 [Rhizobacter sp.]